MVWAWSGIRAGNAALLERSARVLIRQAAEALQELVALQEEAARVVNNQLPMVKDLRTHRSGARAYNVRVLLVCPEVRPT